MEQFNSSEIAKMIMLRNKLEQVIELPTKSIRWSTWTPSDMIILAKRLGVDCTGIHVRQCVAFDMIDGSLT